MQMRILGQARQPDPPDRLTGLDPVTDGDAQAAPGHVAVLRFPAIGMPDHQGIAAFRTLDRIPTGLADRYIGHAVPPPQNPAGSRRQHIDAGLLRRHRRQADIRPVMAVIGECAAGIVPGRTGRVGIDIVLDEAVAPELACDRHAEERRPFGASSCRADEKDEPGGRKAARPDHAFRLLRGGSDPALPVIDRRRFRPGRSGRDSHRRKATMSEYRAERTRSGD